MKSNRQIKNKKKNILDKILATLFILLSATLVAQLFLINFLPLTYLIIFIIILAIFCAIFSFLLISKRISKGNKGLSRALVILLCILLGIGNIYFFKTFDFLNRIHSDEKVDLISVVVRKDDPAQTIDDVANKSFIVSKTFDPDFTQKAITDINEKLGKKIEITDSPTFVLAAESLVAHNGDVILLNESYRSFVRDKIENFDEETKVIYQFEKKTKIEKKTSDLDVTKDSFTMLISGIDTYGPISTSSRSDVNILMTVNPNTKTILMTNIPRDYYVTLGCGIDQLDKLTHAGIYGAECSVDTLQNLFDIDIDYASRVNFSSLVKIIDTLGGVTVTPTTTFSAGGFYFIANQPTNLTGVQALAFSRDRYHQAGGDRDRGKNQMLVIEAIIKKMISPTILTGYMGILDAVQDSFQTSLTSSEISALIKMQLNDTSGWTILSTSVDGKNGTDFAYSLGDYASVMYSDPLRIENAKKAMELIKKGASLKEVSSYLYK